MKLSRLLPDPALCAASGAASGAAALLLEHGWVSGVVLFVFWGLFAPRVRTGIFLLFFGAAICSGLAAQQQERQSSGAPYQVCQAEIRLADAALNELEEIPFLHTVQAELRSVDGAPETGRILVWFGETASRQLRCGSICRIEGELQRRGIPQLAEADGSRAYLLSPGFLNFDAYLGARGCRGIFFVRNWQIVVEERGWLGVLLAGRDAVMKGALSQLPDLRVKHLIAAMFFGCRQGLDPVSRRDFSQAGVVHLFAVSGLHVAMLAGLLLLLLRGMPFSLRYWVLTGLLGLYVLTTGANPPAVRAFCMIGSWCILRSFLLYLPGGSILLWTAAWMLALRPAQLLDIGFLFSFLTAGALVFGSRWLTEFRQDCRAENRYFLPGRRPKGGWGERVLLSILGCAVAFAAGGFLSLVAFGLFLPGSIFVNLLMIPVTALLFPLLLLKICCFWIPGIRDVLAWCILRLFSVFDWVTSLGGMLFEPESLSLHRTWPLLLIYTGFFGLLCSRGRKVLWCAALIGLTGAALALIPVSPPRTELLLVSGAANEEPCLVLADSAARFGVIVNAPSRVAVAAACDFLSRRGIARANFAVFTRNRKSAARAMETLALKGAPAKIVSLMPKGALQKLLKTSPGSAQIQTDEGAAEEGKRVFSSGPVKIFSEKNAWGLVYCNPATDSNVTFILREDAWARTAEFRGKSRKSCIVLENSSLPEVRQWEDKP